MRGAKGVQMAAIVDRWYHRLTGKQSYECDGCPLHIHRAVMTRHIGPVVHHANAAGWWSPSPSVRRHALSLLLLRLFLLCLQLQHLQAGRPESEQVARRPRCHSRHGHSRTDQLAATPPHLLHNLLLVNQEGAHDTVAHGTAAEHAAVGAVHRLLALGQARAAVLRRSKARDLQAGSVISVRRAGRRVAGARRRPDHG